MRFACFLAMAVCAASAASGQLTSATVPIVAAATTLNLPDDLRLLLGKHVVVGRIPLCQPNTYTVRLDYAGKKAAVVAFKANQYLNGHALRVYGVPAGARSMMEDAKKGGIIAVQFEDGTRLDTCGDLLLSQLSSGLSLAPGEMIGPSRIASAAASGGAAQGQPQAQVPLQPCPVLITNASSGVSFGHLLVEALTTSEFQRQVDETMHGGQSKLYLDLKVSNASAKTIAAFEFMSLYEDKMGDETTSATYVSQNPHPIKPGETYKASAMDRQESSQNGTGKIRLFISRVRFDDDTSWRDDGSHSCSRVTAAK